MEWIYLVLIVIFIAWSTQIVMIYRRQAEKLDSQIAAAQANQEEVTQQAEQYEARAEGLKAELKAIQSKVDEWGEKERNLQSRIGQFQHRETRRRPTRHRVETPDPPSGGG